MRIVNQRQFDRLSGYIAEAEADGTSRVAAGGKLRRVDPAHPADRGRRPRSGRVR